MSERSEIAERIAQVIRDEKIDSPFGGDVYNHKEPGKRSYYSTLFSIPRILDGLVRVYGSRFILVDSTGPIGEGREKFESEAEVIEYLRSKFGNRRYS